MALGVVDELTRHGLRPGADVGLIAFDDAPWARFMAPPMSVVTQPAYQIGKEAAELVLLRMAGEVDAPPREIALDTELVVRASSRRTSSV